VRPTERSEPTGPMIAAVLPMATATLMDDLQAIVDITSRKYNSSVSLGVRMPYRRRASNPGLAGRTAISAAEDWDHLPAVTGAMSLMPWLVATCPSTAHGRAPAMLTHGAA
jgi:hypothetical protein